jgi:hypothetical protein
MINRTLGKSKELDIAVINTNQDQGRIPEEDLTNTNLFGEFSRYFT